MSRSKHGGRATFPWVLYRSDSRKHIDHDRYPDYERGFGTRVAAFDWMLDDLHQLQKELFATKEQIKLIFKKDTLELSFGKHFILWEIAQP